MGELTNGGEETELERVSTQEDGELGEEDAPRSGDGGEDLAVYTLYGGYSHRAVQYGPFSLRGHKPITYHHC